MPWQYLPSLMMKKSNIFHDFNEIMKRLMSTLLMWVNCFSLIKEKTYKNFLIPIGNLPEEKRGRTTLFKRQSRCARSLR